MPHRIQPETSEPMRERARQLRREAPIPERILWGLLRSRRLGEFKFRRQQPIGSYVVDYFCEEARLVVELDGRSHDGRERHDAAREAYLRSRGLRVLRILNDDLWTNREAVRETILREVAAARPSP